MMRMSLSAGWLIVSAVVLISTGYSAETMKILVDGPAADVRDVPVCVGVDLQMVEELGDIGVELRNSVNGDTVPGQLIAGENGNLQLCWVIREAKARQASEWVARIDPTIKDDWSAFSWKDTEGRWLDLTREGRPVTRFMYEYDESSDQRRFETYKPFLHVYGINGQRLTNGPDGESEYPRKGILFPHHRGIFLGWNRLSCEGKSYDLWHMKGVEQVCREITELTAGPVLARSRAIVDWRDAEDKPIIVEERTTTVYRQDDPIWVLVDVLAKLKAVGGHVVLGGDPEHAGFQFRAHNDVSSGAAAGKAKYLFHEDGIDAKQDGALPWAAMSYKIGMNTYTVLHMDHPDNPRPNKYSAYRDYGRFGAFFITEIPAGQTLVLKYRVYVTHVPLDRAMCAAKDAVFDTPLKARVISP